jgi:dimethylargininase
VVTSKSLEAPFVRSDAGALAAAIVCAPSPRIAELVPLKSEPSPIADRALEQHKILVRTLRDRGVDVTVLEPGSDSATESLIADCAVILPAGAIIARPSLVERRNDVLAVERALLAAGVRVIGRIEAPGLLDATDVVVAGDHVFIGVARGEAGLRARSNALGRAQLADFAVGAGMTVIELAIAPDIPRLRNVFNMVAADAVIAAPDKVDLVPVRDVRIIEVVRGEEFAAGVLAFGERRVVVNLRYRESIGLLRAAKVDVEAIDLWEFGKAGIGPFQLVLATKRG